MITNNRTQIVKGGLAAGLFGAVLFWLVAAADHALAGTDGWVVLKTAAAPFVGSRALQPGFDATAVVVGMLCHLAISLLWGLSFAALFYGLTKIGTLVASLLWGFAVWLMMLYVVLPLIGWGVITSQLPLGRAIGYHLVFGFGLGLGFLPFQHPRVQIEISRSDI